MSDMTSGEVDNSRPRKCVGVMGRIFGHRFTVNVGGMAYKTDFCGRCGAGHE